ncbi:hypothetical protein K2173_008975 [Erythroxylum novogranatense]|uniref:Uncharacterized protein n=1 Tax=Erythroxylum novogranatense TaxID=1862640 RepID=A0AAV8TVY2_9ROSI|nr:hypothetical protein K2173_008975 [Erythroxylum novogranatense]
MFYVSTEKKGQAMAQESTELQRICLTCSIGWTKNVNKDHGQAKYFHAIVKES